MVTTGAIIHGECIEQLRFNDLVEHPVAVQLGGSDPKDLAHVQRYAMKWVMTKLT